MKRANACRIAVMVLSVLMLPPALVGCPKLKKKAATEAEPTGNPLKPNLEVPPGGRPARR